jgi:hypothetical protein
MNHVKSLALLLSILLLSLGVSAQTTPNLGLTLPVQGSQAWGTVVNGNFTIIDTFAGTAAAFPSSGTGIVFGLTSKTSRFSTSADIVGLFGSGACSGFLKSDGTCQTITGGLTGFTTGNLAPLFTVTLGGSPTTTPALAFSLSNAAANTVFGNFTGSSAAPSFSSAPTFSAAFLTNFPTFNQNTTGNAATATALATTPVLCTISGQFPKGILANGDAANCTTAAGGSPPAGSPLDVQINLNGSNFGADSGNFTYTTGSHQLSLVNQTMSGKLTQSGLNIPVSQEVNNNSSGPSDLLGNGQSIGVNIDANNWGVGKNIGNAFGGSADGWRTVLGLYVNLFGGSAGIHQAIHISPYVFASGDSAAVYVGNGEGFSPCMWTDTSGEGCVGININGTQNDCWASGTISSTTGAGDRNPVFSITPVNCNGAQQLINDGVIIDTSVTLLHTALTGTVSSLWESNAFQIGSLPVTGGTAALSTGIGVLTADIPLSATPGQYQTQNFSATIHDSLALVTGPVFIANSGGPEQCNILTVTAGPTSPQTGTISCAKFHPTGSYIFQGPKQGFGDFDDDMTSVNTHSVVYVLGATDTSHLIIAQRQGGAFLGVNLPYRGSEPAGRTVTGGFTVHPGALCVNTNSNNTACTLEFNTVAWSAGHAFASPTGLPTLENMISLTSTQTSPDSPQSGGTGLSINFANNTQHGAGHPFIQMSNFAPLSRYLNSGTGTTNWLPAPPVLDVQGAMGNFMQFDMSLADGVFGTTPCGGGTIICYKNVRHDLANFNLFTDAQNAEKITLDGTNSRFRFISWGISAPAAEFVTATVNSKQICLADGTNCPAIHTTASVTAPANGACSTVTATFSSSIPSGDTVVASQQSGGVSGWGGSITARTTGSTTADLTVCSIVAGAGGTLLLNVSAQ